MSVVAAGERWPDGSLRPALEDALGAGAVLRLLQAAGCQLSTEAIAAATLYNHTEDLTLAVRMCASGQELVTSGFASDVDIALELDCDGYAAVKKDDAFIAP